MTAKAPARRAAGRRTTARKSGALSKGQRHDVELVRGLELHEQRKYAAALKHFERAHQLAPACPFADYNRANTLHMLDRSGEAIPFLKRLVLTSLSTLSARCDGSPVESLQIDAYYLLFKTTLWDRGFCKEAFAYAAKHIARRRRGTKSIWTLREVRAEVARSRKQWKKQLEEKVA